MRQATLVLTDSGGPQEEAAGLDIPVPVLRELTKRMEGLATGSLRLVGTDAAKIVREATRLLTDPAEHRRMATAPNPFGDGHAAERIVSALLGDVIAQWQSPLHSNRKAA